MQTDLANLLPDLPGNLSGINPNRLCLLSGCSVRFLTGTTPEQDKPHFVTETFAVIEEKLETTYLL